MKRKKNALKEKKIFPNDDEKEIELITWNDSTKASTSNLSNSGKKRAALEKYYNLKKKKKRKALRNFFFFC